MTEDQGKKLIAYVKELAQQFNALEERVHRLEKFESAYYRSLVSPEAKAMIKKLLTTAGYEKAIGGE